METKYNKEGGIGAYKENGTRAFVQTYAHDEVSIQFVNEQDASQEMFIRIRIGTNEGKQLIMLENGRFYMIDGYATKVFYTQELSAEFVYAIAYNLTKLDEQVGNLFNLYTKNDKTLVGAINEVYAAATQPRTIVGYIQYLSDGVDPEVIDLTIRYNDKSKRFEYYSEADGWTLLPKGWQRLHNFVRTKDDLPESPLEPFTKIGVLSEDKAYIYQAGNWEEIVLESDKPGDEYLVQEVYNKHYNGNATGSVIYTETGWTYLVHHYDL